MNYGRKDLTLQEQDTMTVANTDKELESLCARVQNVLVERREANEIAKNALDAILMEAKNKGHNPVGITRHVKKRMETDKQRSKRLEAEEAEEDVAAKLGEFADSPLGAAAVERSVRLHAVG